MTVDIVNLAETDVPLQGAHHLDAGPDGTLWAAYEAGGFGRLAFSRDAGATWTVCPTVLTTSKVHGFRVDSRGDAHLVGVPSAAPALCYYYHGVPNATATDFSWDSGNDTNVANADSADVVAWVAAGVTIVAVAVLAQNAGTFTGWLVDFEITSSPSGSLPTQQWSAPGVAGPTACAVAFQHTGDGKTAVSNPSIYAAWAPNTLPVTMTRAAPRTVGTTRQMVAGGARVSLGTTGTPMLSAAFDGTQFVIAYVDPATPTQASTIERNAADTGTVGPRITPALGGNIGRLAVSWDTFTADTHVLATVTSPQRISYSRTSQAWGAWSVVEAVTPDPASRVSLRPGSVGGGMDALYVAVGTGNRRELHFDRLPINQAPTQPGWVTLSGAADVGADLVLEHTFSDPDKSDSQIADSVSRIVGANPEQWWDGTTWQPTEQWVTTSSGVTTIPAGWGTPGDGGHAYYVKTKDQAGAVSPKSAALHITASTPVDPTISSGTIADGPTYPLTWTLPDPMTGYRVQSNHGLDTRRVPASGRAGEYDITGLLDGDTLTFTLTTFNADGLASHPQTITVAVTYASPPKPSAVLTLDDSTASLVVATTNPAPTGDEPNADHNDIYVNGGPTHSWGSGQVGGELRLQTGVVPSSSWRWRLPGAGVDYQVRVVAVAANGASTSSDVVNSSGTVSGAGVYSPTYTDRY